MISCSHMALGEFHRLGPWRPDGQWDCLDQPQKMNMNFTLMGDNTRRNKVGKWYMDRYSWSGISQSVSCVFVLLYTIVDNSEHPWKTKLVLVFSVVLSPGHWQYCFFREPYSICLRARSYVTFLSSCLVDLEGVWLFLTPDWSVWESIFTCSSISHTWA